MSEEWDLLSDVAWSTLIERLLQYRDQKKQLTVRITEYAPTRTTPQNSRYWATLTEFLRLLHQTVQTVADNTGYSPLEVKRLIAADLLPEQVAILYARTPEVAHDVIKEICGIPTSTRLGTKKFSEFDERMTAVVSEIAGIVQAFSDKAA